MSLRLDAAFLSISSKKLPNIALWLISKPLYGLTNNPFNAWGATIIDSLSTLLVIGLTEEYSLARTHVRQVDFTVILGARSAYGPVDELGSVPVFESIIRYLGGLLSAYDLTDGKDQLMLERAEELADWLIGAFEYGRNAN